MSHAATLSATVPGRRPLDAVERAIGVATEGAAAVLVVAEVVILLLGVVSRFVFDAPLVWSDELASLLFLWLAMVGAAIALRRGAHMRLSTVTARLSPRLAACARGAGGRRAAAVPGAAGRPGARLRRGPGLHRDAGAGLARQRARRRHAGRHRAHAADLAPAPGAPRLARRRAGGAGAGGRRGRAVGRRARPRGHGQLEPAGLLRAAGGGRGAARRAHRLRVRPGHRGLPAHRHLDAARRRGGPARRGHELADPARRAAVRAAGPAGRGDRHGARHGGLPRGADRPRARRPVLRAAGRHAARVGHLGLQGRRHGRGRARAVPRDEAPRPRRGRDGVAARGLGRHGGDDPAVAGADRHRLRHRRVDLGAVHRRAAARPRAGGRAGVPGPAPRRTRPPSPARRCSTVAAPS